MDSKLLRKHARWVCVGLGIVVALWVLAACAPTATPSPEPTATWTATATQAVEPTATSTQTPIPPTATATATPEPTATETLVPTETPTPTATATETPLPTPTETATLVPTAAATATETTRPAATATRRPAQPTPTATTAPVQGDWQGEYFNNVDLSGQPVLVRRDASVGFDWHNDAPAPGLPADGFSVRWTRVASFAGGVYDFHVRVDDGMRVYLDGELILDEWRDESERVAEASHAVAAGNHTVRVEYYDRRDRALASFWWEPERSFADWKGVYWPNKNLLGQPALIRNDPQIQFDWQEQAPAPSLPADGFSARWTRTAAMQEGVYRFTTWVDDGLRVWVDGTLLIDEWKDGRLRELTADYVIAGTAQHIIQVEYYEDQFQARVDVSVERVGDPSYPYWKGEYYSNPDLSGAPVLVRSDRSINFDWGTRSPAPQLPADDFSVRWTREQEFTPGTYRFTFKVDDGFRFYVDDDRLLNEWHLSWGPTYHVDVVLPWKVKLKVEYYEQGGGASLKYDWKRIK